MAVYFWSNPLSINLACFLMWIQYSKNPKQTPKNPRKKHLKAVFRVGVLLTRNWYVLSVISSFPSTCLKLTKLQVERELPWCFHANISLSDQRHHPVLWRKWSYGPLHLLSSSLSVQECNMLSCMCCALAFMSILMKSSFESHAVSHYREEEYQLYGMLNHERKWIWLTKHANTNSK